MNEQLQFIHYIVYVICCLIVLVILFLCRKDTRTLTHARLNVVGKVTGLRAWQLYQETKYSAYLASVECDGSFVLVCVLSNYVVWLTAVKSLTCKVLYKDNPITNSLAQLLINTRKHVRSQAWNPERCELNWQVVICYVTFSMFRRLCKFSVSRNANAWARTHTNIYTYRHRVTYLGQIIYLLSTNAWVCSDPISRIFIISVNAVYVPRNFY